ncbi:MAG: hypothetical protein ABIZ73_06440 [Gemmatimonadaceae bacterium]
MMSIFDDNGIEKRIDRREGVVEGGCEFLSGTATIAYENPSSPPIGSICITRSGFTPRASMGLSDGSSSSLHPC